MKHLDIFARVADHQIASSMNDATNNAGRMIMVDGLPFHGQWSFAQGTAILLSCQHLPVVIWCDAVLWALISHGAIPQSLLIGVTPLSLSLFPARTAITSKIIFATTAADRKIGQWFFRMAPATNQLTSLSNLLPLAFGKFGCSVAISGMHPAIQECVQLGITLFAATQGPRVGDGTTRECRDRLLVPASAASLYSFHPESLVALNKDCSSCRKHLGSFPVHLSTHEVGFEF
ncbi:MAG: hypothetical protein FWD61_01210 [Phycisphaerales bacterium]|nr:hypothetical protein [Phycisphaerales bacterium]